MGKFLPKITIFGNFWDRKDTLLKVQWSSLAWKCSPGTLSPGKILYKSFGANYTKNYHFCRFL